MGKQEIGYKATVDLKQAIAWLEDLVKALREKTIHIENGDRALTLKPEEPVMLELEAAQKEGKEKLAFEFAWRRPMAPAESMGELKFLAKEPSPKPAPKKEPDVKEMKEAVKPAVPAAPAPKAEVAPADKDKETAKKPAK